MSLVEITRIAKTYEHQPLLRGVSLNVDAGEIVCLLGPSGSGKTTLLRIIAGLEVAESGAVHLEGTDLRGVPVHLRRFGLMFQDLALFPHKNVFDNVAFGLQMQNLSREAIRARVAETLELVGLTGFAERSVNNLSGGEQQRVALARSLAPRPRLLMLDEPLGALDRILREQLIADLRAILKRIGMTALYVTHDQDEAFALADRIAIMHDGQFAQVGAPAEIYRAPANAFVARFLGLTNMFPARALPDGRAETPLGIFAVTRPIENAVALVRAENVRVNSDGTGIPALVAECVFRAGTYRVRVVVRPQVELLIETDRALAVGAQIGLHIDAVELVNM
ncbi:MAG: ABC transporter ATP-binding protein [Chloroflexi bacterium]|nr:ABC transporter ATP-binding protein [Chloroflexota bacterium]